ncbi:MAG: glycosyltransferase family 9 protein [Bacteroidia bacterium]
MKLQIPENTSILVARTDAIGDVILTIPITHALKQLFPKNKIVFLSTSYTKPILKYVETIDEIIDYEEISDFTMQRKREVFQKHNIHTALLVYPTLPVAKLMYQLKIPYRIGTSHRWYNWLFCNQLVSFSRKNSDLHEAQLNFKLLKPLGISRVPELSEIAGMYVFKDIPPLSLPLNQYLEADKMRVVLHPKSKGSAREWGMDNYIRLIKNLDLSKFQIIITGTKNELPALQKIFTECPYVTNLAGQTTLEELISLINACDALIAASTGTLHIASVLGKHAIGIFPPIRPMHPGRWAPIGRHTHVFCLDKDCSDCRNSPSSCNCIQQISPDKVAELLYSLYFRKFKKG